ncbi:VIT1/CCC1 transporter family protein [Periweissella beninensis]|uniref:VIT family protein n=1 Tax=Periweissella beninensis TaxID=504936 RepID=A0ABT0VFF9_9LACO|nr:VIT family protein [Periweissella beninensis]MCM2436441.1 VIT family protein [Periweissella beninensis]MCT4396827.1 VIT family protein [Periweissella beninensis]
MTLAQKINILRASVMGANDGILSVAAIVIGVAGATTNNFAIFIAGIAGMIAGTVSMAMGEYVSVNAQKDAQEAAIANEQNALEKDYQQEFDYIIKQFSEQGISANLANKAASEMLADNPLKVLVRERYGFELGEYTSPYAAAVSSMISFPLGSILPLLAITLVPENFKIRATIIAVTIALIITGYSAAKLGDASIKKGILRNVISGLLTMIVTYFIGTLFAR